MASRWSCINGKEAEAIREHETGKGSEYASILGLFLLRFDQQIWTARLHSLLQVLSMSPITEKANRLLDATDEIMAAVDYWDLGQSTTEELKAFVLLKLIELDPPKPEGHYSILHPLQKSI